MTQFETGGTIFEPQSGGGCGRCCGCGRSKAAALLAALVWLLQPAFLCLAVPKFADRFRDFGLVLPHLTRSMVRATEWLNGTRPGQPIAGVAFALPVFITVAVTGVVLCSARNSAARRAGYVLTAAGAILLGVEVASMLLPSII